METLLQDQVGDGLIETVLLDESPGIDAGLPILWRTSIAGGPQDGWEAFYVFEGDARRGHAFAVWFAESDAIMAKEPQP